MEPSNSSIAQPPDYSTYHHVRTLGRGASGTVVLAQEPNSGHLVRPLSIESVSLLIICACFACMCSNSLSLGPLFLRAWTSGRQRTGRSLCSDLTPTPFISVAFIRYLIAYISALWRLSASRSP